MNVGNLEIFDEVVEDKPKKRQTQKAMEIGSSDDEVIEVKPKRRQTKKKSPIIEDEIRHAMTPMGSHKKKKEKSDEEVVEKVVKEVVEEKDEDTRQISGLHDNLDVSKQLNFRDMFSQFMDDMNSSLEIQRNIHTFLTDSNINIPDRARVVTLKYGGNAWNNEINKPYYRDRHIMRELSPEMKSSFLSGNFDIITFSDRFVTEEDFNSIVETYIIPLFELYKNRLTEMERNEELNNKYGLTNKSRQPNYKLTLHVDSNFTKKTWSCGYALYIGIERLKRTPKVKSIFMPSDISDKSLFYYECSGVKVKNIELYDGIMRDSDTSSGNHFFISKFGLFFASSKLIENYRNEDKGISVDEYRRDVLFKFFIEPFLGYINRDDGKIYSEFLSVISKLIEQGIITSESTILAFNYFKSVLIGNIIQIFDMSVKSLRFEEKVLLNNKNICNFITFLLMNLLRDIFYMDINDRYVQELPIQNKVKMTTFIEHYESIATKAMLAYFVRFDATITDVTSEQMKQVKVKSEISSKSVIQRDTPILYKDWWVEFNDLILDTSRGLNNNNEDIGGLQCPSCRQLINWMLASIDEYITSNESLGTKFRIEKSGGDAFRYYLPDIITHTADIDAKLFCTSYQECYKEILDKVVILAMFIEKIMELLNYFRVTITKVISFGDFSYVLEIDSTNQPNILRGRLLRDFTIDLLSIDLRMNYKIIYKPTGDFTTDVSIKTNFNNALLDVGLNVMDKKKITKKNVDSRNYVPYEDRHRALTRDGHLTACINVEGNKVIFTPIPSIDYLLEDLEKLRTNKTNFKQRLLSGKAQKDEQRYTALIKLKEERLDPSHSTQVLETIEQIFSTISPITKQKIVLNENSIDFMLSIQRTMKRILNSDISFHKTLSVPEIQTHRCIGILEDFFQEHQFSNARYISKSIIDESLFLALPSTSSRANQKFKFDSELRNAEIGKFLTDFVEEKIKKEAEKEEKKQRERAPLTISTRRARKPSGGKRMTKKLK